MTTKRFFVFCFIAIAISFNSVAASSVTPVKDSLLALLGKTPETNKDNRRVELLTHLTMLCTDKGDVTYADKLFKESVKRRDVNGIKVSFYALVDFYSNIKPKAISTYLKDVMKYTSGNVREALVAYANLKIKYGELILSSRFKNDKRIDILKDKILKRDGIKNSYDEIAWNALLGQFLLVHGANYELNMNAADYFNQAIKLAKSLPLEFTLPLVKSAETGLANLYLANPNTIKNAFDILKLEESELNQYKSTQKKYPFYSDNDTRMQLYGMFLTVPQMLDKNKVSKYLSDYKKIVNEKLTTPQAPLIKDSYYTTMAYHYQRMGDMNKAVCYVDSGIASAKALGMTFQLPGRLKWKAQALSMMGKYEEAMKTYQEYIPINDSIFASSTQQKMSELQTAFGLQKERAEKAEMKLQHHNELIAAAIIVFLLLIIVIIYQIILYVKNKKENKLKSQLLIAKDKILDVDRMKDAFTKSVIRELRTPMSAISGSAEIIMDKTQDEKSKVIMSGVLKDNVSYFNYLIDIMMQVSELTCENGEDVPMELTNINDVCTIEMNTIRSKSGKNQIKEIVNIPEEGEWVIGIHKKYFIMMLHQILNNAFNFTSSGSISIDGEIEDNEIKISVTDTGIGIPEDKYEFVFESYSKLDEYSKGMGMGLYICKLIAKRLNGKVWIDKEYKSGTRIIFTMPCNKDMRLQK